MFYWSSFYKSGHYVGISPPKLVFLCFSIPDAQTEIPLHCKDAIPKTQNKLFPEIKLRGLVLNSYIHVSVSVLYIPTINLQENRLTDRKNI